MSNKSNCQQVVLFDGDENRTELCKNVQQLSKIPSQCEFFIFCNENDPIQDILLDNLNFIQQVRVRRSSISAYDRILDFLKTKINQYSFILIVCDSKSIYECSAHDIWKKYGHQKLYIMQIKDKENIIFKDIFDHLRQHSNRKHSQKYMQIDSKVFSSYQCPQCSKSFDSDEHLQEHSKTVHVSFINTATYLDASINIAKNKKVKQSNTFIAEQEHVCNICNDLFESKTALIEHISKNHSDEIDDFYE